MIKRLLIVLAAAAYITFGFYYSGVFWETHFPNKREWIDTPPYWAIGLGVNVGLATVIAVLVAAIHYIINKENNEQ